MSLLINGFREMVAFYMNKTADTLIFQRSDWRKIGRSAIYRTTRNLLMQIAQPLYFPAISATLPKAG